MENKKLMSQDEIAQWMNKHSKELEKRYPGKWVVIKLPKGVIAVGSLKEVVKTFKKKYPKETPFIELVPRKEESGYILIICYD
jgi:NOL1/NOP2/fmu family ribosome biogenesis protein